MVLIFAQFWGPFHLSKIIFARYWRQRAWLMGTQKELMETSGEKGRCVCGGRDRVFTRQIPLIYLHTATISSCSQGFLNFRKIFIFVNFLNQKARSITLILQQLQPLAQYSVCCCLFFWTSQNTLLKHELCISTVLDKNSADKNFRRTKLPKFRAGAENFVRRKILSAENFVRRIFVQNLTQHNWCFMLLPKI